MMRDPTLRAASISNLVINITFDALIANFFPVYAFQLGASQSTTNSMFSARAVGSTLSRVPAGVLVSRFSARAVLGVALATLTVGMFGFSITRRLDLLAILLVFEGVFFGVILMAGQALTAEESAIAPRGAAIGFYSMSGSIGNGIGPFLLGLIADRWSLRSVFVITSLFAFLGLLMILNDGSGKQKR
jgi:MFS family permease